MSEEIIVSAEQLEQVIEDLINDNNLLQDRIIELEDENKELKYKINKAIEYIENNSLYETEYDYDYEENIYLSGIDDEIAKKDLLEILKGED